MGQPRVVGIFAFALAVVAGAAALMSFHGTGVQPSRSLPGVRIASITPAGTSLLVAMGQGNRIVGVSNYDDDREGVSGRLRVGDYQNIDWEKLSECGANLLVLQYAQDRLPGFIPQRCAQMGIRIVNLKLDTIDEICAAMTDLARAIGDPAPGESAAARLREKLEAVKMRVKGLPTVKTLVVTSDSSGFGVAGPGEFLDEILRIAGGENAAAGLGEPYAEVDREMIMTLKPEVVIRLVPDGDRKPQVVESGDQVWQTMGDLPAVKNHRVYVITDWDGEMPGFGVGELAGKMAALLHPGG
jgi:iron complex transport system substrate-binding protein